MGRYYGGTHGLGNIKLLGNIDNVPGVGSTKVAPSRRGGNTRRNPGV